ncbi:acyl-CoA dehydrogenase [Cryptosporangium aurantiacum]|uniref:Acyl-CoA dehydrogenase n=1 Tax=Cryptosporangium aurantiacum TaxID=134849 RepID=A0A1M7PIB4_9ACTN|nr:acyl-CoA dehydrogenase [Cryptosporangium aurantiacum]SHN16919.1 Acyl-CoA dehydrogenase [Cryptosporangium aurantiacum]
MPIALTDDHRQLADVVRSFAAAQDLRHATRDALADAPAGPGASWKQVADLGWVGLHLPEEYGGSDAGLPELAVVAEQLGTAVAPGPFLTAVAGAAVVNAVASDAVRSALLPALADGSEIAALGLVGSLDLTDGTLSGTVGPVPGAVWADHVVLRVGTDDLVVLSTANIAVEPTPGLDPALGAARISVSGVAAPVLPGAARVAIRIGRALAAAEAAGGAQATLAMALEYAKVRQQFGRTIGSFQAVKHHLANMLVDAEAATASAWDAARASGGDAAQADLASAVAAAVALRAYQTNAQKAIQVLGGIGFTWEHDAHLYLRRAIALAALWGPVAEAEDDVSALARAGVHREYAVDLPPEAETFRVEARAFVESFRAAPAADRRQLLVDSGYLVPHWQKPWGRAAGAVEQLVIEEELADIEIPALGIGGWVTLTIAQHATPEQIERWIPASLRGDLVWCQLFSEPNAGSDAAAVQSRATKVDGGWRVTGQKVWTSNAHLCNRGLATVRTDPQAAKHKGITTVVVDLTAPGVEVRPLREITGEAIFNEVFFDDVFVPDEDVVGAVNAGWTVARATLGNERVSIGGDANLRTGAASLADPIAKYRVTDAGLLRAYGRLIADEQAGRLLNLRMVVRAVAGSTEPSIEGAITKLIVAELSQSISELSLLLAGPAAIDGSEPALAANYLMSRAMTIAGGTSEISRNVISERILGLPRDPLNR